MGYPASTANQLEERLRLALEEELEGVLAPLRGLGRLEMAARHMIFPPGKRARPLLCMLLAEDFGAKGEELVHVCAALELLHTASMIHDDLPGLDNDDTRRGRSTCHVQFGESTAILAGDLLVPIAIQVASKGSFSPTLRLEMIESLSAAYADLCVGQELDSQHHGGMEEVLRVHRFKTGALFRSACELAALGAHVNLEIRKLACEVGESIGIAFQVVDDFLDRFGSPQERGRPKSSDIRNQKNTLWSAESPAELEGKLRELLETMVQAVGRNFDKLEAAVKMQGRGVALSRALVNELLQRGQSVGSGKAQFWL